MWLKFLPISALFSLASKKSAPHNSNLLLLFLLEARVDGSRRAVYFAEGWRPSQTFLLTCTVSFSIA